MARDYRYLIEAGVTLGVDFAEKTARIAVTLCNEDDDFSRDTGKQIIDLLFDANDNTLKALSLTRNVFSFPHTSENKLRKEILVPLVNFLRGKELNIPEECLMSVKLSCYKLSDSLEERELLRFINCASKKICTLAEMREFADYSKTHQPALARQSELFINRYEEMLDSLNEDQEDVFKDIDSSDQVFEVFFDWAGSANAIISAVQKFAEIMRVVNFKAINSE